MNNRSISLIIFQENTDDRTTIFLNFLKILNITFCFKDLNNLKAIFATYAGVEAMDAQLQKEQGTLNTLRKMVSDGYGHKKYYAAKSAGENIIAKYPLEMQI